MGLLAGLPVTLECVGGPFDGLHASVNRGECWRVLQAGWSGTYQREGEVFRWKPD